MNANLRNVAPAFADWFENAARSPVFSIISEKVWIFSLVQVSHLLFMAVLGGAVLALNLRVLGVILPGLSPQEVERATRPWFWAGAVGTIVTGVIMATSIALTILASAAFFVKFIALIASILLSVVVFAEVRGIGEQRPLPVLIAGGIATVLGVLALTLFASTRNLGTGALLVAISGFALFGALVPQRRAIYAGGIVSILGVVILGSLFLPASEEGDAFARWLLLGGSGFALVFAIAVLLRERRGLVRQGAVTVRIVAFASTLAWITTAAAGRWIGFS